MVWLIANHYPPWPSAWQDGLAIFILICLLVTDRVRGTRAVVWFLPISIATLSAVACLWIFPDVYLGDLLMVVVYLAVFYLSISYSCSSVVRDGLTEGEKKVATLTIFASAVVIAAIISVGMAVLQYLDLKPLGIWMSDIPPGGRPYANINQPNNFCTIAFLGVCAIGVLTEQRAVSPRTFLGVSVILVLGMVLSGSRTAWLQTLTLWAILAYFSRDIKLQVGPRLGLTVPVLFAVTTLLAPEIAATSGMNAPPRPVEQQLEGGTRLAHWSAMLDAILRQPWTGYGWQRVSVAQQAVALDHPAVGEHIEHSHNIVLDFLIWAGLPIGGLLIMLFGASLWKLAREVVDSRAVWLLVAVTGLLVHGMLELPLEYAYFLIPLGLSIGAIHGLAPEVASRLTWPNWVLPTAGGLLTALIVPLSIDYLRAEENYRMLRLESARIGVPKIETPAPDLMLLDQLQALLEFARTEARPGMSDDEVDQMRRVSQRFGYPPVMLRYALATGLNGRKEEARLTIGRLCKIHPKPRCDEGRDAWNSLQERYSTLKDIDWPPS